jgi:tripartite-type tricarboxylate transporter receptor subunit TctC
MKLLHPALLALALLCAAPAAADEAYPSRPIRIFVGFAAGGGTDVMARIVAPRMSERLGQPVIIENRAGAGGNLATEVVAKSAADGYTLLMGTIAALAINPSLYKNLPFDPQKDLKPYRWAFRCPTWSS